MDPQHPDKPADIPPPIPVARPATVPPVPPPLPPDAAAQWWAPRPISRLQALGDILLVMAVLVVPQAGAMLIGSSVHTAEEAPPVGRLLVANSMIWATVTLVAVYLTWRSGQPLSSIGLRRENPFAALGFAMVATIVTYMALMVTAVTVAVLTRASQETMTGPAREIYDLLGRPSWWTIIAIAASAGVFEEIVFRGFLLTRLRVVAGSWTAAIAIGSVLFAVPHAWEGRWAIVLILPVAVVLSITFLLRRGVLAPILAHFLFNFLQLATIRMMQESPEWQRMLEGGS
jgi:membrane protease YdiL (CAAX protease family)